MDKNIRCVLVVFVLPALFWGAPAHSQHGDDRWPRPAGSVDQMGYPQGSGFEKPRTGNSNFSPRDRSEKANGERKFNDNSGQITFSNQRNNDFGRVNPSFGIDNEKRGEAFAFPSGNGFGSGYQESSGKYSRNQGDRNYVSGKNRQKQGSPPSRGSTGGRTDAFNPSFMSEGYGNADRGTSANAKAPGSSPVNFNSGDWSFGSGSKKSADSKGGNDSKSSFGLWNSTLDNPTAEVQSDGGSFSLSNFGNDNSNANNWKPTPQLEKDRKSHNSISHGDTTDRYSGSYSSYGTLEKPPTGQFPIVSNENNRNDKKGSSPTYFASKPVTSAQSTDTDWSKIEIPNEKSSLKLDISLLWYPPTNGNGSNKRKIYKRYIPAPSESGPGNCICTDYEDCLPENRMHTMIECLRWNQVCCRSGKLHRRRDRVTAHRGTQTASHHQSSKRKPATLNNDIIDFGNDKQTHYAEYPWALRLIYSNDYGEFKKDRRTCGATLIHDSIALTSASCLLEVAPEQVNVRAGEWADSAGTGRSQIQERQIQRISVHPHFKSQNLTHDLALIFLNRPFDPSDNVGSICLPGPRAHWDVDRCVMLEWRNFKEKGMQRMLLKKTDVTALLQGKCPQSLNPFKFHRNDISSKDKNFICTQMQNAEPCLDDVGASLLCPSIHSPETFIQIGIFSRKTICNGIGETAVFTNIANDVDWIVQFGINNDKKIVM